jgi:hypothetical protein
MKVGNLLFSAAQFAFAVLVILTGVLFLGLQYAPHMRIVVAEFIAESSLSFSLVGLLILGCGILLMLGFYTMNRGVYIAMTLGKGQCLIDSALVRGYLEDFWKKKFPGQDLSVEVCVSKDQKLELFVEMPSFSVEEPEAFLAKVEKELCQILKSNLGYERDFQLSLLIK